MKKYIFLFSLFFFLSTLADAQNLFFISRNLNRNVIKYDVQLTADGKLNQKEPMHVYWYNYEHNPHTTNELNFIQRKMAYGYSVVKSKGSEAVIKLKAYKDRTARICQQGGKWVAIITINDKECQLTEIFAHCPSKTSCDYIELIGIDKDGNKVKEHIKN